MKSLLALILFLNSLFIQAQYYKLDSKNSSVEWTGYGEVGKYAQSGSLGCKEGVFEYHNGKFVAGKLVLDMETISHSDRKLVKHLKADDFFNVNKHPTSTFEIIEGNSNNINGLLTLNGITNEISMNIQMNMEEGGVLVQGEISLDRTKFDIKYNSSTYFQDLGSYAIKNEIDIKVSLSFKIDKSK